MFKLLILMTLQFCVQRPNIGNKILYKNSNIELCVAAEAGNEKEVKKLLKIKDIDLYQQYTGEVDWHQQDETPMTAASRCGHVGVMKLLINAGIDPNKEDYKGRTPLGEAVHHRQKRAVEFLLTKKVDVDKVSEDNSPLGLAATKAGVGGNMGMMETLLAAGADINARVGKFGLTPLLSGIGYPTEPESKEVVEFLLSQGADPDMPDINGQSPLFTAINYNRPDIVNVLLNAGADPNGGESLLYTPLYCTCLPMHDKEGIMKKALLAKGATFNKVGDDGVLPIFKVAKMQMQKPSYSSVNHFQITRVLLDNGQPLDDEDDAGKTPLFYAGDGVNWDVMRALLDKGASLRKAVDIGLDLMKKRTGGKALIHIIAENGYGESLCDIGLTIDDLNTLNNYKKNILHCALGGTLNRKASIKAMVNAGCLLSQEDKAGKLPIEIILKKNRSAFDYIEIVQFLYCKMKVDKACATFMLRVEQYMENKGTSEVKEFLKKEKAKKRKADDNDNKEKLVKKAKVVQTGRKGKGKKK